MQRKKWQQFSKEELQEMCSNSQTLRQFAEKIGYSSVSHRGYIAVKEAIEFYDLDTSTILTYENVKNGRAPNFGKIDYSKFTYDNDLTSRPSHKRETIRKNLIDIRGHRCEQCGLTEWLDKPISLELHHIDGDSRNNNMENLQLLCPNCHSQTSNYKKRNKIKQKVSDDELAYSLSHSTSIRQAVMKLGLSDTVGGLYTRCYRLMDERGIRLLDKKQDTSQL